MFANLAASSEQPPSSSMVPYQGNHPISDDLMTMSMGFNFSNMSSDPFVAQYASQYFGNFDNNHQTAYPTSQQQHELYLRSQQASQHVPNHEDYTYFPQKSSSNYNNNSQVGTYGNAYLGTQQPGEAAKSQQKQESKEKAANTVSVDPFEPIPVKSPRGSKKCIEGKEEGEANKEWIRDWIGYSTGGPCLLSWWCWLLFVIVLYCNLQHKVYINYCVIDQEVSSKAVTLYQSVHNSTINSEEKKY